MELQGAGEKISRTVQTWPWVIAQPHRFGGVEFLLGRREIGHVHGDWLVDIPFPTRVRDELVAAGLADPHHILPDSGWISFHLRREGDVERALDLLHRSYDLAVNQKTHQSQGV